MRRKILLICTECFNRNYKTYVNHWQETSRLSLKKYCDKCHRHTMHQESR